MNEIFEPFKNHDWTEENQQKQKVKGDTQLVPHIRFDKDDFPLSFVYPFHSSLLRELFN
jgi:hypothetical protein